MASIGAVALGFHEGGRSEYLAQYAFSAFGTSFAVPRQEDHGLDLHCTLAARVPGDPKRLWVDGYYAVQIKSVSDDAGDPLQWEFPDAASVRWFVQYPAPLLLCTVDKRSTHLRVYQTFARFDSALSGELPDRLVLQTGGREPGSNGVYKYEEESGVYHLGDPVLDFSITELYGDERPNLERVLRYWVEMDRQNVDHYLQGRGSLSMPFAYATNEVPTTPVTLRYTDTPDRLRSRQEQTVYSALDALAGARLKDDDGLGALLAALQLRHRNPQGVVWGVVSKLRSASGLAVGDAKASDEEVLDTILGQLAALLAGPATAPTVGPDEDSTLSGA